MAIYSNEPSFLDEEYYDNDSNDIEIEYVGEAYIDDNGNIYIDEARIDDYKYGKTNTENLESLKKHTDRFFRKYEGPYSYNRSIKARMTRPYENEKEKIISSMHSKYDGSGYAIGKVDTVYGVKRSKNSDGKTIGEILKRDANGNIIQKTYEKVNGKFVRKR